MKNYEITDETYAILPIGYEKTKIIEKDNEYIIDNKAYNIMEENCEYYGSSYNGRIKAAQKILNCSYKLPILIEESSYLIFFPTKSSLVEDCIWFNAECIKSVDKNGKNAIIHFKNNSQLEIESSKLSIDNQIYRAAKLETIIRKRINK